MPSKKILVTGGAGFIGSLVNKMLHQAGFDTTVIDNLSYGSKKAIVCGCFYEGDIGSPIFLDSLFQKERFDAVIHFAALTNVGESVTNPLLYYRNNVAHTLTLLEKMLTYNVKKLIFSSSAAVYGFPQAPLIEETHPILPINPYGESKWMVEKILADLDLAYQLKSISLRYFNAAGGDPEGKIKVEKTPNNLIPIALNKLTYNQPFSLFGTDYSTPDGTCIRDYIHTADLGSAHILALEKLLQGASSNVYNLGNGSGYSVKEVLNTIEEITGQKLSIQVEPRRKGDPPYLVADATKALNELDWRPEFTNLKQMVADAWKSMNTKL